MTKRDAAGWFVVLAVSAGASLVATRAAPPVELREASADERRALDANVALAEPSWRAATRRAFPGDVWSQDDDFGNAEKRHAWMLSQMRGVRVFDVLRAIDEGLRRRETPGRRAGSSPCKPRPFYD